MTEKKVKTPKASEKIVAAAKAAKAKKVVKKVGTHREELAAAVPKKVVKATKPEKVAKKVAPIKKEVPAKTFPTLPTLETTLLKIDPLLIEFDVKNNPRVEYGDMKELERFIQETGAEKLPPIKVKKVKDTFVLVHGYRRLRAILSLIAKKENPGYIRAEVVGKKYTAQEELLDHLTDNEGKNLTPFEQAFIYQELAAGGMKQAEIRKRSGKSKNHIIWMIRLAEAPVGIHDAIIAGKVSITMAVDFINTFKDKAEGKLLAAISIAEKKGEKKVDTKSAEEAGFVKKHTFINTLDKLGEIKGVKASDKKKFAKLGKIITLLQTKKEYTDEEFLSGLLALLG